MTSHQQNGSVTPTTITANGFAIGVTEDRNRRCRRTMEDAHSFVTDYLNVPRQGFFAIFDGHAGRATAEWCGNNFHRARILFLQRFHSRSLTMASIDIGRVATATRWQACSRNSQLGVSRSGSSSEYERGQIIWMYSSGGICGSQE